MINANPIHNRFMRLAMYQHQRQHGTTVVVRRKIQVDADPVTGETRWQIKQWSIRRVVCLPGKIQREVRMNAASMTANRAIVQGSGFDSDRKQFLFDRRFIPSDLVLAKDDWIVFNNRHFDIEIITEYEYSTAWHVIAKELQGRQESREIELCTTDQLDFCSNLTATL